MGSSFSPNAVHAFVLIGLEYSNASYWLNKRLMVPTGAALPAFAERRLALDMKNLTAPLVGAGAARGSALNNDVFARATTAEARMAPIRGSTAHVARAPRTPAIAVRGPSAAAYRTPARGAAAAAAPHHVPLTTPRIAPAANMVCAGPSPSLTNSGRPAGATVGRARGGCEAAALRHGPRHR